MTAAKKKKKEESSKGSEKLSKAIMSQLREVEPGGDSGGPSAGSTSSATDEESLLNRRISIFGPKLREMAVFCRQFATLLEVNIPLVRSLKILGQRTEHPRLKNVVQQVATEVEQGNRLSTALAKHPRIFSPLFINVVQVGEAGGILEDSIKRLADVLESKASIRRRIIAASAYPIAALIVAAIILIGLVIFAIPRFQQIYVQINAQLPSPTRKLIAISDFLRTMPEIYIPAIVAILAVLYLFRRTETGKRFFDWCKLRLPLLSVVSRKIAIARMTRTAGSLLTAGIPLLETLKITSEGSENLLVSDAIRRVRDRVEAGGKLEEQLREESHVFPPIVVDMLAIGDEGGALDVMLNKLADTFDEEVDSTLRGLSAIIEPVLIVLVGLVVIFIALALLLPYFQLAKNM